MIFFYRSTTQTVFHQESFSVCNVIFFIIIFSLKLPVQLVLITTEVMISNPGSWRWRSFYYLDFTVEEGDNDNFIILVLQ
jgi:hypothetical protein